MKLISAIALFSLASCIRSPNQILEDSLDKTVAEFTAELKKRESGNNTKSLSLNWNQALGRLYYDNANVLQSNYRIQDSALRMKQVWKDLIPSLSASLSDSATIENLGDLFVNSSLRVNSFISLGNLLNLPKRVYTNKLTYIGVELSAEQTMRNEVITLYRIFKERSLLDLEFQALDFESELAVAEAESLDDPQYREIKESLKEKREAIQEKITAWKVKVGDFYMGEYNDIYLDQSSLPRIHYTPSDLDFSNTKRWGNLQLNLLALERISQDAQLSQLYRRYLPTTHLSVTAPALYSSNSANRFRFEDFRLSPSFNWRLDTRDSIGQQIDRYKRDQRIKKWTKDKRRRTEVAKLLKGRKALAVIQENLTEIEIEIKEFQELVKSGDMPDVNLKAVTNDMISLIQKKVALQSKEIDICTTLWLLDEDRWTHISKDWKRARLVQEAKRKKQKGKIPFIRFPSKKKAL